MARFVLVVLVLSVPACEFGDTAMSEQTPDVSDAGVERTDASGVDAVDAAPLAVDPCPRVAEAWCRTLRQCGIIGPETAQACLDGQRTACESGAPSVGEQDVQACVGDINAIWCPTTPVRPVSCDWAMDAAPTDPVVAARCTSVAVHWCHLLVTCGVLELGQLTECVVEHEQVCRIATPEPRDDQEALCSAAIDEQLVCNSRIALPGVCLWASDGTDCGGCPNADACPPQCMD